MVIAVGCGITLTAIAIMIRDHHHSFDYHLNLHEDSILIETDLGVDTVIHFDDLEEYIIRDNL